MQAQCTQHSTLSYGSSIPVKCPPRSKVVKVTPPMVISSLAEKRNRMEFERTVQAKLFSNVYKKSYFSAVQAYLAPEIQTAKKKNKKKTVHAYVLG